MKHVILFLLLIGMAIHSYSQKAKGYLARAELNHKLGCIDIKGNEIIPIKYDDIGFWGDNLIPVNIGAKKINYLKKGGKWGYCNSKGKLVIDLRFDDARTFNEGFAAVKINKKWGFIDTEGKVKIKPLYQEVQRFHDGFCAVSLNKKWGFINKNGIKVIKPEYGEVYEFENEVARAFVGEMANENGQEAVGSYCLINKKGERIIEPKFQMISNFSEGLAKVEMEDSSNKYYTKKGFINTKGEIVVPLIYDDVEGFREGMAVVGIKDTIVSTSFLHGNYTYGYINTHGEEIITPQFSLAYNFFMGRAVVSKGKHREIGFFRIDSKDGSIINHEELPKYALINREGNYILNFDYRQLSPIDSDRFIAQRARYNGDGVINIKGETIVPFEYTNLKYIGNNLFTANDGGGRDAEETLIDLNNKVLIRTKKYGMPATKYQFRLINIRTNKLSKSGFIDTTGKLIIKDKYDMIWDFEPTDNN